MSAHDPTICSVCKARRASSIGIGDRASDPRWICQECLMIVEQIKATRRFDSYELMAVKDAGQQAGALLDKWDKTDLALLAPEEWTVFCRTMIEEFGRSIRRQIVEGMAPF